MLYKFEFTRFIEVRLSHVCYIYVPVYVHLVRVKVNFRYIMTHLSHWVNYIVTRSRFFCVPAGDSLIDFIDNLWILLRCPASFYLLAESTLVRISAWWWC